MSNAQKKTQLPFVKGPNKFYLFYFKYMNYQTIDNFVTEFTQILPKI